MVIPLQEEIDFTMPSAVGNTLDSIKFFASEIDSEPGEVVPVLLFVRAALLGGAGW